MIHSSESKWSSLKETSISDDWMSENPNFMGLKEHWKIGMLKMEILDINNCVKICS